VIDRETLRDILYGIGSDTADYPFWDACAEGRFLLHRCGDCGRHYWPASLCTVHGGRSMAWVEASGRGAVHDHVIMRHAYGPEMKGKVPYNVAVIRLEEGPLFHSNVVDCPPEDLREGLPVAVAFTDHANGMTIPVFRRA
jgi:uncharacterized OB-fold protein